MRRRVSAWVIALALGLTGGAACAQAVSGPASVAVPMSLPAEASGRSVVPPYRDGLATAQSVSPGDMVAPEEAQVRIDLSNAGDVPISDIRVCRENGAVAAEMGALAANAEGATAFTEAITPTDEQLDEGELTYLIRYVLGKDMPGEEELERVVRVALTRIPAKPGVEFTRALPVTCAKKDEEIAVAYRVKNTGNVALTNLKVSDALAGDVGALERLDPGAQYTFVYRFALKGTATSKPTLAYSHRATRDTFEKELAASSVYLADEQLDIQLEADRSTVSPGDLVTLTYRVTNNGTATYDKLRLSDQGLGELDALLGELRPGDKYVFTKTVAIKSTTTFLFILKGRSAGGSDLEMASNPLTVAVTPTLGDVSLKLFAKSDTTRLTGPGTVHFTLTVRNDGGLDIRDVVLSERERGAVRSLAVAAPGDTVVGHDAHVEEAGVFVFTAELTDAKGGRLTVFSDPVEIAFGPDGVAAAAADAQGDLEVIEGLTAYQLPGNASTYLQMMVGVLAVLAVLVTCLAAATVSRRRKIRRRRDQHIRKLRRSYRREQREDREQTTKPIPIVRQDTLRRAWTNVARDANSRKPGTVPGRDKGGK